MLAACILGAAACTPDDHDVTAIEEYQRVLSPDGEVSAYVYHYDSPTGGLTQVMMDFVNMDCGMGSAAWYDYDIGIELRWIDATTLEVVYPDGKAYQHNASGDYLGCYDHAVRVVMVPRSTLAATKHAARAPADHGDTPSPDGKVVAGAFRYASEDTAITQVVVDFPENRGCRDSAVTFYDDGIDLRFDWADETALDVHYPEGERFDHPPWGTTVRCVTETVEIRMVPDSSDDGFGCEVTDPSTSVVDVPWTERHHLEHGRTWYGSESLAVLLHSSGTWHGLGPEGNYGDKLWLWSADWDLASEPEPALEVTARSVHDSSLTSEGDSATHGYSDYWQAMLTGLEFPEAGCWQVDATYRDASVSFIVLVR